MATQIRIYTINRGALDAFAREFQEKIRPVREKLGFEIDGAWCVPSTNQFVWLMRYDGPQNWDDLDRAFFESDERKSMQPDPARHIARMENHFMQPVT